MASHHSAWVKHWLLQGTAPPRSLITVSSDCTHWLWISTYPCTSSILYIVMWCCECVWRQHGIHYKQRVWAQCSGCRFPVMWIRWKRGGLKEKTSADAMFPLQLEETQEVVWWLGSSEHAVHLVHRCALFIIPWASELSWNLIAYSWQMLGSNKLKTESNLTSIFQ